MEHPSGALPTTSGQACQVPAGGSAVVTQGSDHIHNTICDIARQACRTPTPFVTATYLCARLRSQPGWSCEQADQVADAVLRLLIDRHRPRAAPDQW
jgi:hypothetical protein